MRLLLLQQKKADTTVCPMGSITCPYGRKKLNPLYFREGTETDTSLITS